jgi:hypothetical protein
MVNQMREFGWVLAVLAAMALTACGGDGTSAFAGVSSSGSSSGGAAAHVAAVQVSATGMTVPADGSAGPTINALVLDANNNALANVPVTFAATAGGVLQNETTVTTANGTATATLSAGTGATVGSQITVTAAVGSVSGKVVVTVAQTQETITLLTSSPQLPSDGSKPVTISAVVRNASNQLMSGVAVNFTATSGGISAVQTAAGAAATPQVAAGTTDANGTAAATLTPLNPTNRIITVTATAGTATSTVTVAVVGTTLTVTGPSSLIMGASGTYTVALSDSGSNPIASTTVTLASATGNTLSAPSVTTDPTGHATFQLTATKAGNDTVSATALGLTATQATTVSSQSFNFTVPAASASVDLNTAQPVTLVWTNAGVPQANQTVDFSTTRGLFAGGSVTTTGVTNGNGSVTVSISSSTAGPAVITASASGVTAQLPLTFIATNPSSIDLQASPATVPTQGQSTITAIVRDAADNLVSGQTVAFQLTDVTGGTLSVGSAVTDVQGQAETVYTAGTTASASNGVQITASVTGVANPATVNLTVGGQTLFISLGTGNTISENASKTQFIMPFSVQALDSAGNAVPGVPITFNILSLPPQGAPALQAPDFSTTSSYAAYAKGYYIQGTSAWVQVGLGGTDANPISPTYCLNEDVNGTGIFEASEDLNGNGKLDPGDVASVSPGSITTDATGSGNINVTYPEDHANWVQVKLTATATVAGTQASTTSVFWLPILASYLSDLSASPPGQFSPYGSQLSCANPN